MASELDKEFQEGLNKGLKERNNRDRLLDDERRKRDEAFDRALRRSQEEQALKKKKKSFWEKLTDHL